MMGCTSNASDSMNGVAVWDAGQLREYESLSMLTRNTGWVAGWIIDLKETIPAVSRQTSDWRIHWYCKSEPDPTINYTLVCLYRFAHRFSFGKRGQFIKRATAEIHGRTKQPATLRLLELDVEFPDARLAADLANDLAHALWGQRPDET